MQMVFTIFPSPSMGWRELHTWNQGIAFNKSGYI